MAKASEFVFLRKGGWFFSMEPRLRAAVFVNLVGMRKAMNEVPGPVLSEDSIRRLQESWTLPSAAYGTSCYNPKTNISLRNDYILMISSSLTHLRNVATSTTVPSTLWPLKPLNMANFYGKSDQNTIGHSGALGGKAMYVVFWFVFFCTRVSFWFERSNIHNLPHFRVSPKHVAGSISEGVMCSTLCCAAV